MLTVHLLFNALALGSAYALVALGFVLIVNATGAVNFAHGDLVMGGGYIAVMLGAMSPIPLIVMLPLVGLFMLVIGVIVCFLAYFPLIDRPPSTVFISTLLFSMVLQNIYIVVFGPQAQAGPPLITGGTLDIGQQSFNVQALGTIAVAAVLVGLQYLVFFRTQIGRRLRAVAEDREMARAVGIPAFSLIAATFGVGTALGGIAGAILSNQFFVSPTSGVLLSVYAYIAVIIGGWGSIPGAVLGAIIIAFFQVFASIFVSYTMATGALYVALLIILFLRPQGLFGERVQRRV